MRTAVFSLFFSSLPFFDVRVLLLTLHGAASSAVNLGGRCYTATALDYFVRNGAVTPFHFHPEAYIIIQLTSERDRELEEFHPFARIPLMTHP